MSQTLKMTVFATLLSVFLLEIGVEYFLGAGPLFFEILAHTAVFALLMAGAYYVCNRSTQEIIRERRVRYWKTVGALVHALRERDPYTGDHCFAVALVSYWLAERAGLDQKECEWIMIAGLLHDIGKISIPGNVLNKIGPLTETEKEQMRGHSKAGYRILREADFQYPVAEIARHHHENLDGSGYPKGLKGEQIWYGVRIVAVADRITAMASDRPYRPARSRQEIISYLEGAGKSHLDPDITQIAMDLINEGLPIQEMQLAKSRYFIDEILEPQNQVSDIVQKKLWKNWQAHPAE